MSREFTNTWQSVHSLLNIYKVYEIHGLNCLIQMETWVDATTEQNCKKKSLSESKQMQSSIKYQNETQFNKLQKINQIVHKAY